MLRVPSTQVVIASPRMYNMEEKVWYSVYNKKEKTINIPYGGIKSGDVALTRDDLMVLKGILQNRSTNEKTLGLELSQSVTKRSIRKLEKYGLYKKNVLWRRPVDLNTIAVAIPLGEFQKYSTSVLEYELNETEQIIPTITRYSWPFLNLEKCIEFQTDDNNLMCRPVLFARISGLDVDLLQFTSKLQDKIIIGMYEKPPGSIIVLPSSQFDGEWIFDINEFLDLVEFCH
jgi:hypothetical protein